MRIYQMGLPVIRSRLQSYHNHKHTVFQPSSSQYLHHSPIRVRTEYVFPYNNFSVERLWMYCSLNYCEDWATDCLWSVKFKSLNHFKEQSMKGANFFKLLLISIAIIMYNKSRKKIAIHHQCSIEKFSYPYAEKNSSCFPGYHRHRLCYPRGCVQLESLACSSWLDFVYDAVLTSLECSSSFTNLERSW